MSLVVELCGLPGAGKSYLAREVVASAIEVDVAVRLPTTAIGPDVASARRIGRKLSLVTGETLRRPVASAGSMRRIVGSGQGGVGPVASRWVQWAATQRLIALARSTPGVHLFDEGVTQALWSLGLRGDPSRTLAALRQSEGRWSHPDLIIALDPPIEVIEDRLSQRRSRHSRLQELADAAERRAELSRGRELLGRLLDWWVEVLPSEVSVVRLGEGPGASRLAGASVLAAIEARLHPSGIEIG